MQKVEELESRLISEFENYSNRLGDKLTAKMVDDYFKDFITDTLHTEFSHGIYDSIKPLNSDEAIKFLTITIAQFKTYSAAKRVDALLQKLSKEYWDNIPVIRKSDYAKEKIEEKIKYLIIVFSHYETNINLFKDSTETILQDFKDSTETILQDFKQNEKLKTNLSVKELALLFKMLKDLKPNIFELESEAELLRFISVNFETKKNKEDLSTNTLRKFFNKPDSKAAEFWQKHFFTLNAEVKKFK